MVKDPRLEDMNRALFTITWLTLGRGLLNLEVNVYGMKDKYEPPLLYRRTYVCTL